MKETSGSQPHREQVIVSGGVRREAIKITGRVMASESKLAIQDAVVKGLVFNDERLYALGVGVTNQDGWYELTIESRSSLAGELAHGFALNVIAPGFIHGYCSIDPERLVQGKVEVDFTLLPGSNLIGRVLDEGMRPVSGASVRLYAQAGQPGAPPREPLASTDTNGGGLFSLPLIASGEYKVHAQMQDCGTASLILDVHSLGRDVELDPLVLSGVGSILGRLMVSDGMPAKGAVLTALAFHVDPRKSGLGSASAVTGYDGSFRFSGLKEGAYELRVDGSCKINDDMVSTGNFLQTLVLEDGHGIALSVTEGGERIAADSVVFLLNDGTGGGAKICAAPEADGRYYFYTCSSGTVTISVSKGDLSRSTTVQLREGQVFLEATIALEVAPSITGELELLVVSQELAFGEIQYNVVLQNDNGGSVVIHRGTTASSAALIRDLPVGDYHGRWIPVTWESLTSVLTVEFDVSVGAGSRTQATVSVRQGALVELVVSLGLPPATDLRAELVSMDGTHRFVLSPTEVKEESIHTGSRFQTDSSVLLSDGGRAIVCGEYEIHISSKTSAIDPLVAPVTLVKGNNLVRLPAVRSR